MTASFDHQILDPAQSRLRLRADLVVTPHDNETFVIEDPLTAKFYLVGRLEWSFFTQIDGMRTIAEAIARAATQAPQGAALTEREGIGAARWLVDQGLAKPVEAVIDRRADSPKQSKPAAPFNPFMIRLGTINPDETLSALDARLGWLWSKWFFALWLLLGLIAASKLSSHWSQWNALPLQILDRDNWLRLGIVWCLLKLLHEFGHGLSCRHFGIPVRNAGLLLIFFAPVPFVDVSGSWRLPSRGRRIVIAAAGMYLELLVAFAAMLLWNPMSMSSFDRICLDVVALAGFNTVAFNANPLMRFDGYYILSDTLGIPNLAVDGRKYLSSSIDFWFRGLDVRGVTGNRLVQSAVKSYAVASTVWKFATFLGIALSLIAGYKWWGLAASLIVGWYWFGLSLPKRRSSQDKPNRSLTGIRRQRVAFGAVGIAVALLIAALFAPVSVSAPAVVEYAPLTVLRADADGFVFDVRVREGQTVEAGELLLEMVNDELASELKRLEIEIAQAGLRSAAHLHHNELSKQQAELAQVASLEKQRTEIQSRRKALRVCAPRSATIATSDLESLKGRYVKKGEILLVLGSEDEKELLVSAASTDEKSFVAKLGGTVGLFRPYGNAEAAAGRLSHVDPRIGEILQHHALGADSGGDVPVKFEARDPTNTKDSPQKSLVPRIAAKVELDAATSRRFRAGQRMIVRLSEAYEPWGSRLLQRWHEYLIELASRTTSAAGAAE